jgi:hypothetical protein
MASRTYAQREWRLLSWWLATFHADAEILMNARVGPSLTALAPGMDESAASASAYARNRWTDAIVIYPDHIIIVEAKLQPDPGIFSQLIHYARMFRSDPQFAYLSGVTLQLVALVYRDDPQVAIEAPWYNIRWEVYQPALTDFPPAYTSMQQLTAVPSTLPQDWPARLRSWGIQALSKV